MELGSLSRLLLAKLATELRTETLVGRSDPAASLSAHGARSASGAMPQPLPPRPGPATQAPPPATSLSPTGQLVAQLMRADPGAAAMPHAITSPQPIVDAGVTPQTIAQTLSRVVSESGLFYESHLTEWAQGKRDLESLLREPQARLPDPAGAASRASGAIQQGGPALISEHLGAKTVSDPGQRPAQTLPASDARGAPTDLRDRHLSSRLDETSTDASSTEARSTIAEPRLGAEASRIVRHQLDALAAEQIIWQGTLRPGEPGEIEIGREQHAAGESSPEVWRARLALELPQLGRIDVAIALDAGSLSLAFRAAESTRERLSQRSAALQGALSSQALRVQGIQFLAPRAQSEHGR